MIVRQTSLYDDVGTLKRAIARRVPNVSSRECVYKIDADAFVASPVFKKV